MKNNNNTKPSSAQFLFFPGCNVLYPLLSLFCLFFYVAFFGRGAQYQLPDIEVPSWPYWCVIAIASFCFASIWAFCKGYVTKRFTALCAIILYVSFLSIISILYGHGFVLQQIYLETILGLYCLYRLFKRPVHIKSSWPWLVPIIYIVPTLLFKDDFLKNILFIELLAVVALSVLAICETVDRRRYARMLVLVSAVAFYLFTTFVYFPCNPFLSFKNIKKIAATNGFRDITFAIEKDGKYSFVDGRSLFGEKVINTEFDICTVSSPHPLLLGGFDISHIKDTKIYDVLPAISYPIIMQDGKVFFSAQKNVCDIFNSDLPSEKDVDKLTANLYFDYLDLISNTDSATFVARIKEDYAQLQDSLDALATTLNSARVSQIGCEKELRNLSRYLTLGMLNALSSDLILHGHFVSALKIYSYQLFLTLYDSNLYKGFEYSFNIDLNKDYGNGNKSTSFSFKDVDLKRADMFAPWTRTFSLSVALAELLLMEHNQKAQKETIVLLKELLTQYQELKQNVFDTPKTIQIKQRLTEAYNVLSQYKGTPNIAEYVSSIQQFFYKCIGDNVYPDYNSFFLNRFNEVTPMVPLYPLSLSAYEELKESYNKRFEQDIKNVNEMRALFNQSFEQTETLASLQAQMKQKLDSISTDENFQKLLKNSLTHLK